VKIASIDLGTNTFRLLIAETSGDGVKRLHVQRTVTRLGGGFVDSNMSIPQASLDRALGALIEFSETINSFGVERVRAVATSVVRRAANGREFVDAVLEKTGIPIEVVTGEQEAALTAKGVLGSVDISSPESIIFDIGGGSTEFILVGNGAVLSSVSTDLGVVHLWEQFINCIGIPDSVSLFALKEFIKKELRVQLTPIFEEIKDAGGITLCATSGTPTTLAAIILELKDYDHEMVNGYVIDRDTILKIYNTLIKITNDQRTKIKGLEKGREDLIIPGIILIVETMSIFSAGDFIVSDGGLLEGVALSMI